jgi:uncharacterized protein (TIGR00369 family)
MMNGTGGGAGGTTFDADAALARLTREMTEPPFHDVLKPQPVSVDADGTVVVRPPFRPEFRRGRESRFYHGGVLASLADIAAHAAIAVHVGRMVPTIDLRIDYLWGAPAGDLSATERILIVGRSVGRADVEIVTADGKIVAVARGAFSTREN